MNGMSNSTTNRLTILAVGFAYKERIMPLVPTGYRPIYNEPIIEGDLYLNVLAYKRGTIQFEPVNHVDLESQEGGAPPPHALLIRRETTP